MKKFFMLLMLAASIFNPLAIDSAKTNDLDLWYRAYNMTLFNNELPDKMEIDHQLRDPSKMAVTECEFISRICYINMNPDYEMSDRVARLTLIHEMCHADLFVSGEYEFNEHGPKWQRCMHDKANKNGFDNLW